MGLLLEELPTQLHFGREFIAYNFIINFWLYFLYLSYMLSSKEHPIVLVVLYIQ